MERKVFHPVDLSGWPAYLNRQTKLCPNPRYQLRRHSGWLVQCTFRCSSRIEIVVQVRNYWSFVRNRPIDSPKCLSYLHDHLDSKCKLEHQICLVQILNFDWTSLMLIWLHSRLICLRWPKRIKFSKLINRKESISLWTLERQ